MYCAPQTIGCTVGKKHFGVGEYLFQTLNEYYRTLQQYSVVSVYYTVIGLLFYLCVRAEPPPKRKQRNERVRRDRDRDRNKVTRGGVGWDLQTMAQFISA